MTASTLAYEHTTVVIVARSIYAYMWVCESPSIECIIGTHNNVLHSICNQIDSSLWVASLLFRFRFLAFFPLTQSYLFPLFIFIPFATLSFASMQRKMWCDWYVCEKEIVRKKKYMNKCVTWRESEFCFKIFRSIHKHIQTHIFMSVVGSCCAIKREKKSAKFIATSYSSLQRTADCYSMRKTHNCIALDFPSALQMTFGENWN